MGLDLWGFEDGEGGGGERVGGWVSEWMDGGYVDGWGLCVLLY